MDDYCVGRERQANGQHEVHLYACAQRPEPAKQFYLGQFPTCAEAVSAAQAIYLQSTGCYWCSPTCHAP